MKTHAIVVLNDGETWAGVDGSSICIITEAELQALIDGDINVYDIQPMLEIMLKDLTPKTSN